MMAATIDAALSDRKLLGAAIGDLATWATWRAVLAAAFGGRLNREQRKAFAAVSGGRKPPAQMVHELVAIIGRRGGKSRVAAAVAAFIATCIDHSAKLSAGELGFVLVLAASRSQAAVVLNYIRGFLVSSPILAGEIEAESSEEIRLKNGIIIGVHTNSFRTVRGRTLLGAVFDETAYWRDESSANPDLEVYRAVLPALGTTGGMLVIISSPYRKNGLIFTKFRDHFGQDSNDVLVVRGGTEQFNPTIDASVIERARASDPTSALSEWDAEFRADIAQFLDDASIDAAIDHGRPLELPPLEGVSYRVFVDASAGRHDAFCVGICHRDGERMVADVIRGRRPPFDPASVAADYAVLAKQYRCSRVTGDNYSGEWVAAAFRDAGCEYVRSELPKSALYLEGLPVFTQGAVSIPDQPQLVRELRLLERRTARSGKDSVDHGISGSDDFANVLFGAMWLCRPPKVQEINIGSPVQVGAYEYEGNDGFGSGSGYAGSGVAIF